MSTTIHAEENWQSARKTIRERNKFMFNNSLLSDVEFLLRGATEASERIKKTIIPAHKYVLAIGSPVFFAMFYGQLAETADTIELPDCDSESLLELLRYLYCDEVELTGSNVMQVLYLANKYVVPSLAAKCTEFLQSNLSAENVFTILPSALKLEEKNLVNDCWEIIDDKGSQAVKSEPFKYIDKALLVSVLERSTINCPEVHLFEAMMDWASNECKRIGCADTGQEKRKVLGEKVLYLCRFPLMTQDEFVETVLGMDVLDKKEIIQVFKYFTKGFVEMFCFPTTQRVNRTDKQLILERFEKYSIPGSSIWSYTRKVKDCITFSVNQPVKVYGVTLFGSEGSTYDVEFWFIEKKSMTQIITEKYSVDSSLNKNGYFGCNVMFDKPVQLSVDQEYTIEALIQGPNSWHGKEGKCTRVCQGVTFKFLDEESPNQTSAFWGQFPQIIFTKAVWSG